MLAIGVGLEQGQRRGADRQGFGMDDLASHDDTLRIEPDDPHVDLRIGEELDQTLRHFCAQLLDRHFDAIHGMIHCSGGGQTKCLKYLPGPMKIVKDNLFTPPIIFDLIKDASGADAREMYQVFNMGTRLEIYTNEKDADTLINISKSFGVDAQVIGRVEASEKKELVIKLKDEELLF